MGTKGMSPVIIQCCVCLKVREGDRWIVVEEPYTVMQHASHTYCPLCKKASFGSLQELLAHKR